MALVQLKIKSIDFLGGIKTNYRVFVVLLAFIPGLVASQCLKDCDFSELTYRTELLESNLRRIQRELVLNQRKEEQLFNELQLFRYNDRRGSIQSTKISSISIGKDNPEMAVQNYPNSKKLREVEKAVSEIKAKVYELEESAAKLKQEIQRIEDLNDRSRNVSRESLANGVMINVVDSSGTVLGSEYCAGSQCLTPKTLSVDIAKSGTYYLQLISASTTESWGNSYKIIPSQFVGSRKSGKLAIPIHIGESVSGTLQSKEDVLEYFIEFEKAVDMRLEMSSEVASASGWKLELYDSGGHSFASFDCSATRCKKGETFLFTPNFTGRYKLSVASGSEFSSPTGGYTLQFSAVDNYKKEVEPNDRIPQKVSLGENLVGFIDDLDDRDHYSIEVIKPGRLDVMLTGNE